MAGATYRETEYAKATEELASARARYEAAKSKAKRRSAALDIEFWSNKTAFLANLRRGAFADESA